MVLVVCQSALPADSDYSDKDFSVRLPAAFLRFTEVSAMGGATVANRWSSAINPASAAWMPVPSKYGLILAPYYSRISFDAGTNLNLFGESATWDAGKWGVFQPTISQIRSNSATNRQGLTFDYAVDTIQLLWAKRFDDWAVGAVFNYADADITYRLGPMQLSDANADSYRLRLGGLYEPAEKWLTGLIVEYGYAPYDVDALVFGPMGPMTVHMTGAQHQFVLRPGVSYEYADYSSVYLDYQYGWFHGDADTLNSHRVSAGVDHRLLDWFFVRGSASVDARGNAGWSCGLGAYMSRSCSLDLGYRRNTLPELRPEFGRSDILQVTFSVRF